MSLAHHVLIYGGIVVVCLPAFRAWRDTGSTLYKRLKTTAISVAVSVAIFVVGNIIANA